MQDEASVWLHRATQVDSRPKDAGVVAVDVELGQDLAEANVHGAIDDDPHGALVGVLANVGHRAREVRIAQPGHGDQKVVGEGGAEAHGHSIRPVRGEAQGRSAWAACGTLGLMRGVPDGGIMVSSPVQMVLWP